MQYLEPIIGGIAAFALGMVWYTVLFGKLWQKESGISDEEASKDMLRTHGLALVFMIVMSFAVNRVIGYHAVEDQTFMHGALHGILSGLWFAVPATAINYLYQRKSLKLFFIDAAYLVLLLGLSGGVMAALKLA